MDNATAEQSLQIKVPTLKLKEKIREYTKSHREQLRANSLDALRFGIGEIKARIQELENLTEKDVTGLAGRIKRRKHATNEDMYRLSHAFLQDEKNIETFNKIPGAIQVLVKELTGKDSERQLSAAECLCNLSLGQAPVCEKISSLAGSYLVTYLHTTETQLVRICLWTLANILATGHKGATILMQMQLLPQLWKLYTDDEVADTLADFREDAAICLHLIALNSEVLLRKEDRDYVFENFMGKNPTCLAAEYHLQIIFHVFFYVPELVANFNSSQLMYLINYSLSNICNTKEFKTVSQHLKIVYAIRVLANLLACHPNSYSLLLQQLSLVWHTNLGFILNTLFGFQNVYLTQELLWFLKNILNLESSLNLGQNNFLEKLNICKSNILDQMPILNSLTTESMIL
ncbi:hypothetical protein FF38_00359 [Lucilia cuprina]|uniref:Transmembrane and coiled-coil domain-containing protein 6 n=1 Tax=Lucilia cuprina TaxID=7375 RepID=A0A0L0BS80_LUCCU|nr:Transmembrane and coiled-coil domain-containing protein 6 [Lucilia cuprina]KNC22920.1 hypothetical protein FF38_00359 [Lucilia cuprina]